MCGSIPQDPSSHALIQTFVSSPALCFLSLFRLLSPLFSRVTCESVLTAWGVWQQPPPPPCTGAHSISARFSADSIPSQQRPASQHGGEPTPTKTRLQSAVHQSPLQADDDQGAIDAVLRRRCQKGRRCGGALAAGEKSGCGQFSRGAEEVWCGRERGHKRRSGGVAHVRGHQITRISWFDDCLGFAGPKWCTAELGRLPDRHGAWP